MNKVVEWTRNYLNSFGGKTKAVIGISGGKDSTIAAAICVEAVGADRVIGVLIPQHKQYDIDVSRNVCKFLGIKSYEVNIGETYDKITGELLKHKDFSNNSVYYSNTPARLRMTVLYGVAALLGDCRVVNTCNRSEDFIGYSTKWGDMCGDFSPLARLTVREVKQLGYELGLPAVFIEKKPEDGLSGKTDEDNIGFTYDEIDDYLLKGIVGPHIDEMLKRHKANQHKYLPMPTFEFITKGED